MKTQFERRLAEKDVAVRERESLLAERERAVAVAHATVETQTADRLGDEAAKIAVSEALNARRALEAEMQARAQEIAYLQNVLTERSTKLAEAQNAQAEARIRVVDATLGMYGDFQGIVGKSLQQLEGPSSQR